jgi:hypothetical protein
MDPRLLGYNRRRQKQAERRRLWVTVHLAMVMQRGGQTAMARHLGVNRSTICRDVWRGWQEWRESRCQHR